MSLTMAFFMSLHLIKHQAMKIKEGSEGRVINFDLGNPRR
jgi:hypothetical protein